MCKLEKAYELWALGHTEDELCTDFEICVATAPLTELGKQSMLDMFSKLNSENFLAETGVKPWEEVKIINLVIEAVKDFSETERSAYDVIADKWIEL